MKELNTEYGYYKGNHENLFMFKNILKDIIRPITNKYVIFKCKNIWNVKKYIKDNNLKGGIYTSYYIDYFNKHASYVGLNTKFANIPYFPHGVFGIFISDDAIIGKDAVIFQNVTIGSNTLIDSKKFGSPKIGNNVYIGAGAKIIGNIKIGDNVRIGANAIVVEDVPSNSVVVSTKGKIIRKNNLDNRFIKVVNNELYYYKNGKFKKLVNKDVK